MTVARSRLGCGLAVLLGVLASSCRQAPMHLADELAFVSAETSARIGVAPPPERTPATSVALDRAVREWLSVPLTEDSAIRVALYQHREVASALTALGIARAEWIQAGRVENPTLSSDAESLLSQSFVDLLQRPLREEAGRYRLVAARYRAIDIVVARVFEVRRALVVCLASAARQEICTRLLELAQSSEALMTSLHRVGNVTDDELTEVSIACSQARLDMAADEASYRAARERLNAALGLASREVDWSLDVPLAAPRWERHRGTLPDLESRAIEASVALKAARALVNAAAQDADLVRVQSALPMGSTGAWMERTSGESVDFGPALSLEIPILDDGSAQQDIARHRLALLLHDEHRLAVTVRSEARALRDHGSALEAQWTYTTSRHAPLVERRVQEILRRYNAMQLSVFRALSAQREVLVTERKSLHLLEDLHLASLDLEQILAGGRPRGSPDSRESGEASSDPR